MLIRKGFSFKLRPNGAQARKMSRFAGCTRFVYNKGLAWNEEQRKADPNFRISYKSLSALLPGWKAENSWLAETYSQCLQQAMKDLFSAFKRFFDGDAKFPKFHKKFITKDSFRYPQNFKIDEARRQILLPGIGWVRYRRSRFIEGKPKNVTVSREADGWHVSIQTELEHEAPENQGDAVGIDMGVKRFVTLSDGTFVEPCDSLKRNLRKLKFEQRRLSRMTKFGSNWRKQKQRIARLHQHIANIRKDFLEKQSLVICKNHAVIVREDLKIKNMTASAKGTVDEPGSHVKHKSGLNRTILDQGWGMFFQKLEWKAQLFGAKIIKVPPAFTSQTCPACLHCEAKNRPTQALFACVLCGYSDNADHVAAENILTRGLRVTACGEAGITARTRVNPGHRRMGSGQQQEPIEEITGLAR